MPPLGEAVEANLGDHILGGEKGYDALRAFDHDPDGGGRQSRRRLGGLDPHRHAGDLASQLLFVHVEGNLDRHLPFEPHQRVELDPSAAGDGPVIPVPYGIDVAPDGGVWFSQLNAHRIGRLDPETGDVRMFDTPFTAPRRLRFDSRGRLWIPGFSSGVLARFDPATGAFQTWDLPIEPRGSETPYALNVDRRTDTVWVCGTQSDTLIRFVPTTERFTVYPLPTRVSYTREIDFDDRGAVWTSNSNLPAWQIEGAVPKVIRLELEAARARLEGQGLAPEASASPEAFARYVQEDARRWVSIVRESGARVD